MHRRNVLIAGGAALTVLGIGALVRADMGSMEDYGASAAASRASLAADPALAHLIGSATLAANSHNTQPWRFRVRDSRIEILPDLARRTPEVDPDDHHLFISLGCAAENLGLAGASRGRPVEIAFSAADGALLCDLGRGEPVASDLAEAIALRQSTRAEYDGRAAETATLAALLAAVDLPGVDVALVTERAALGRFRDLVIAANTEQMTDPAFMGELKSWLRFNPRQALAHRDGLFSACSGNPSLPSWIAPALFDLVVTASSENDRYRKQIDSSAGIAVFFAERNDPEHWTRIGRAFQRFALRATALGLKTAHLNQPVEQAQFRAELASLAGRPGGLPFLAIRFGFGPTLPYALRRDVADVLA